MLFYASNVNNFIALIPSSLSIQAFRVSAPKLRITKRRLKNKAVVGLPTTTLQSSLASLERRKPFNAQYRNTVLKELRMNVEVVARIERAKEIPPKPPDETVELITTVHNIHCYNPSV